MEKYTEIPETDEVDQLQAKYLLPRKEAGTHDLNISRLHADVMNVNTGTKSERLELERHILKMINEGTYSYSFIQSYLISVGYQMSDIKSVFRKLTGISPDDFMEPSSYLASPPSIPGLTNGWGESKDSKHDYYFVNSYDRGYAVFGQKGDLQRDVVEKHPCLEHALVDLKKKVKDLHTYDKFVTEEIMEKDPAKMSVQGNPLTRGASDEDPVGIIKEAYVSGMISRASFDSRIGELLVEQIVGPSQYEDLHIWADGVVVRADQEGQSLTLMDETNKLEKKIKDAPYEEVVREKTPQDFFDKHKERNFDVGSAENVQKVLEEIAKRKDSIPGFSVNVHSYEYYSLPTDEKMFEGSNLPSAAVEDFFTSNAVVSVILEIRDDHLPEELVKKVLAVFTVNDGMPSWDGLLKSERNEFFAMDSSGLTKLFEHERMSQKEQNA